jgi:HEAT repeat protein
VARALLLLLVAGEPDRALLEAHGIGTGPESLRDYLAALRPGERERAAAAEAVRDLRSGDPATRHEALLRLGALKAPPLLAIREAAASTDPEVRRVAARLLDDMLRRVRKEVLLSVLRTIADERAGGLAEGVLGVAPIAAELAISPALAAALRATLRAEDLEALRFAAAGGDIDTRCAAVRALGAAPDAGPEEAAPYLDAPEERLRLAAALAFADRGDRRCLPVLLALLAAEAPDVRRGAAGALRAARGGGTGYDPLGTAAARREAVAAWGKWLEAQPPDAAWEHPLPVGSRHLGRTLVSFYAQHRVVELDAEGRRTFEATELPYPWTVQGLPNGHRLVALYVAQQIVEYDDEGAEIARLPVPGRPGGFQRLDNGNTLVAVMDQRCIVELKPDGAVAAKIDVTDAPSDVRLLDNGRLLVSLASQVVEMERTGRVVWSLDGLMRASTAQRLENGNTLVAERGMRGLGRAVELDATGRVVWERTGLRQCNGAERLPDGSTLVADTAGVREIAPDGKERWLFPVNTLSRATRD